MARYWLMKSEPEVYSFADLVRDGRTVWEGVRNYQARNLLRDEIAVGDGVLYYHSNAEPPAVVGIAKVVRAGYPDPSQFNKKSDYFDPDATREAPRWFVVDIAPERALKRPVTLPELRDQKALAKMVLLNRSRLSVQPVTDAEWRHILALGNT
jgi:predicted RNA-binding protein with PUA-like domain